MRSLARAGAGSKSASRASVLVRTTHSFWSRRMIRLNANATTTDVDQAVLPRLDRTSSPTAADQRRFVRRAVDLRQPGVPDSVLGASRSERQRLLSQCETFKPEARWMLD